MPFLVAVSLLPFTSYIPPFGVSYRDETNQFGHVILGIGYANAPGHNPLVVSNDPWGGIQRIQTFNDFHEYEVNN